MSCPRAPPARVNTGMHAGVRLVIKHEKRHEQMLVTRQITAMATRAPRCWNSSRAHNPKVEPVEQSVSIRADNGRYAA